MSTYQNLYVRSENISFDRVKDIKEILLYPNKNLFRRFSLNNFGLYDHLYKIRF